MAASSCRSRRIPFGSERVAPVVQGSIPMPKLCLLAPLGIETRVRYLEGRFEAVRSGLRQPAALAEQILVEVQSGLARSHSQLRRVFNRSLAHHQGIELPVDRIVGQMIESGMLRFDSRMKKMKAKNDSRRQSSAVSRAGTCCVPKRSCDSNDSSRRSRNSRTSTFWLRSRPPPIVSRSSPSITRNLKNSASNWHADVPGSLRLAAPTATDRLQVDGKRLLSCLKVAHVALTWTELGDMEKTAAETNCYAV